ncbi:unnamed protein product [marine sediment metagenome]|uniref:Bacteriophage phiJL001 Gp84 N-terminal domain-containing protein n=1 Tax=marine sediment metagenome TaxID=412755 RepID=X0SKK9_9ZZZZ
MEDQTNTLSLEDAFLWFFDIRRDSSNVSQYVRDRRDMTFVSDTYTRKGITFEPPAADGGGTLQNFKLALDNTTLIESAYLENDKYFDQDIEVRIVSVGSLDTSADSIVFRGLIVSANADESSVILICGTYNLRNIAVPNDMIYAKSCRFVFKGEFCKYAAGETICDHYIQTCTDVMSNRLSFGGANNMSVRRV